jgi:hypothetical protein
MRLMSDYHAQNARYLKEKSPNAENLNHLAADALAAAACIAARADTFRTD